MENTAEVVSLLQELRDEAREQKKIQHRQNRLIRVLCVLLACFVIAVILALFILLPQFTNTLDTLNGTMDELDAVLVNVEDITEQLKNADLEGTVSALQDTLGSAGTVIEECADGLSATLDSLQQLDIQTLNDAIESLYEVVSPLANLFSR